MHYEDYIRVIENFPKEGISFKDISPLLANAKAFKSAAKEMADIANGWGAEALIGPEARGFVIGAPVAIEAGMGFIMARKKGKLPGVVVSQTYTLEYSTTTIELPRFAMKSGMKVVLIDDLMATGGTLAALKEIVEECGAIVVGVITLIELCDLKGRELFKDVPYVSLVKYAH